MNGQNNSQAISINASSDQSSYEGSVYYLQRRILLLAPNLIIGPKDKTHQRKSCRIIVAYGNPFTVEFAGLSAITTQAIVLAADSGICNLVGEAAHIALLDFTPATNGFGCIQRFLQGERFKEIDPSYLSSLKQELIAGQAGTMTATRVEQILTLGVELVTNETPQAQRLDPRIQTALRIIETLPFSQINLAVLADACHLSKDRFRHLFKDSMDCSAMQYARQTAVWRVLKKIDSGTTIVEAALQVGFHDTAHFYHAYSDLFGVSISERNNPRRFRRVRCFN